MLVLGAEPRSFVGRIWTGDVVGGAAARSHCPVVVVAPEWDPSEEHGRILVGLKSPGEARELLAAGLDLAHECKAELVVVHAWKLDSGYDDIVANRVRLRRVRASRDQRDRTRDQRAQAGAPGGRGPHRGAPRPGRVRAGRGLGRRRPSADLPAGARNRPSPPRASRPSRPARSALPRRDPPATQRGDRGPCHDLVPALSSSADVGRPRVTGSAAPRASRHTDRASVTELDTANTLDGACQEPGIVPIALGVDSPEGHDAVVHLDHPVVRAFAAPVGGSRPRSADRAGRADVRRRLD